MEKKGGIKSYNIIRCFYYPSLVEIKCDRSGKLGITNLHPLLRASSAHTEVVRVSSACCALNARTIVSRREMQINATDPAGSVVVRVSFIIRRNFDSSCLWLERARILMLQPGSWWNNCTSELSQCFVEFEAVTPLLTCSLLNELVVPWIPR